MNANLNIYSPYAYIIIEYICILTLNGDIYASGITQFDYENSKTLTMYIYIC